MLRQLFPHFEQGPSLEDFYRPVAGTAGDRKGLWRTNMVTSLNGSVEIDGVSKRLSSRTDRKIFQLIRAYSDAVLIGSGNALAEGYTSIPDQNVDLLKLRRQGNAPVLVVTTRDPDSLLGSPLASSTSQVIIVTPESMVAAAQNLAEHFQFTPKLLYCGQDGLDFARLRLELDKLGLANVACEGGPTLLGLLVGAGVIDEMCLSVAPLLAQSHHGGFLGPNGNFDPRDLRLESIVEDEGTLFSRYRLL